MAARITNLEKRALTGPLLSVERSNIARAHCSVCVKAAGALCATPQYEVAVVEPAAALAAERSTAKAAYREAPFDFEEHLKKPDLASCERACTRPAVACGRHQLHEAKALACCAPQIEVHGKHENAF
jgi:hypothetical protein